MSAAAPVAQLHGEVAGRSLWVDAWRTLRRNRAAVVSGIVICVMSLLVIVGPWLSPYSYCARESPGEENAMN